MAVVFDSLGFNVTIRPQQSFLMSSIIRCVVSHPLEGNIIRVPGKKGLSRIEKKDQESGRITERDQGSWN